MNHKPILKTMVPISGGTIEMVDTIEHDKKLWLVPFWIDQLGLKQTRPARLIRLDSLPHQAVSGSKWDYVLNTPMPREIFETQPLKQEALGFEVLELPDIWFELLPHDDKSHLN